MKKSRILLLGLCIFLTACAAPHGDSISDYDATPSALSPVLTTSAPVETDETICNTSCPPLESTGPNEAAPTDNTLSSDADTTEVMQPSEPIQSNEQQEDTPRETAPKESVPPETEPPYNETEPTVPQTTAPPVTEPLVTEPISTEPPATEPPTTLPATVPPETTSPATEPPVAEEPSQLDCQEAMDIGNTHGAASYGWTVDPSLHEGNAGFHFGSWVFLQEGQTRLNAEAIGQVNFLYREMKRLYPDLDLSALRFRVHAFKCSDDTYEVRVYYA